MRRLLRILLNVATALSLLMSVATAGLWVRSYRWEYWYIVFDDAHHQRYLGVERGAMFFGKARTTTAFPIEPTFASSPSDSRGELPPGFAGFAATADKSSGISMRVVRVPLWLLRAATVANPPWRLARRRRRNPVPAACPLCGYDLRATPGRCPECGTAQVVRVTSA